MRKRFFKPKLVLPLVASLVIAVAIGVILLGATVSTKAHSSTHRGVEVEAHFDGFQQVPSVLTKGSGTFTATISRYSISYTLTYSGLSSPVTAAHIHFAQREVNGGVIAFLCGGGKKPACPPHGGTVTGTITAADILAIPTQGLAAGDFAGAVRAIQNDSTYVNVHTTRFPEGEIRGQIHQD